MPTPVEVPKLGNTVEDCRITRWVKHKGDVVAADETVAEIETDKATFEVPSPVSGTLLDTFFDEGALVPVFTNLFVIGNPGDNIDPFRPRGAGASACVPAVPPVARPAAVLSEASAPSASPFSPRARRFAQQHQFHPEAIAGSGPGGRVLEGDLRRLCDAVPTPAAHITSVRERIARRMRESLASTAQYTLHGSADARGLLALRAGWKGIPGLAAVNLNHLVTGCVVEALLEVPALNAEFIDGAVRMHSAVHIGFACDTPRGLLVPVVRNAQDLAVDELAARMIDLTRRAVDGTIPACGLTGSTFTVSNLGGLGIEFFTPLLNSPQVAILGVGAIQLKPVRRDGRIEYVDTISLSLTCDHQVIDGAPGARFLQVLAAKIANVEAACSI
ncbi:MAG: dihydrolipoamide acetyltransferase family protein [Candidatus Solibacter sp.]